MSRPRIRGKKLKAEPLPVPCPCGAKIAIIRNKGVLHYEPTCIDFDKMEPLEYLQFVRRHHGIPDEGDN